MKKRILYVEDNFSNTLLVERIVASEGHELYTAVNGEAGLEMVKHIQPDLIFMDIHLPGIIDGIALTRRLKQQPAYAHIPIVMLTAYGDNAVETQAAEAGCDGFLRKPADIRQIQAAIRQHVLASVVAFA